MVQNAEEVVRSLVEERLQGIDIELLDVHLSDGSLRLVLDSDAPLDLDRIADASKLISNLIDDSSDLDFLGSYTLEVSSPGVERILRTPSHFQRFVGSKVTIKMKPGCEGPRRLTGIVRESGDDAIVLEVDASPGLSIARVKVMIEDIERAKTVFEWGSPKPPKSKLRGGAKKDEKNSAANKRTKD